MNERRTRVLHIVRQLDHGGIENWLLHVFRHMPRDRWEIDVLVHETRPGALDEEARSLGVSIMPGPAPSRLTAYTRNFRDVLRAGPPYDVVHSHVHHFSGYTLELARRAGVPVRIAHSHSDSSAADESARGARRLYLRAARRMLERVPTDRLAASTEAALALFGPSWSTGARDRVLPYGIDLRPFHGSPDGSGLRKTLGLPPGAFVVGHVGRFHPEKNHAFLLDVITDVCRRDGDVVLLLVGTGPLRPEVEDLAVSRGLGGRVFFAGERNDVPDVMCGAMDVFLLPSLFEGLPMVGIEAQAAGLPCVFSTLVTREISVVPPLTRYLPLGDPASWATAVLAAKEHRADRTSPTALLDGSAFDVRTCVDVLADVYTRSPGAPGSTRGRLGTRLRGDPHPPAEHHEEVER
jgi:glycosyltransferase involved in cell wall biosynthesis